MQACFLFKHLMPEQTQARIAGGGCTTRSYKRGQAIIPPEGQAGVLTEGALDIYRTLVIGKKILLNRIKPGAVFGISELFIDPSSLPSEYVSKAKSRILYIPEHTLFTWFQEDAVLMKEYLRYVHGRIQFLNQRIACLSYERVEDRLTFLLELGLPAKMTKTDLADYLGISRASLYRVWKEIVNNERGT